MRYHRVTLTRRQILVVSVHIQHNRERPIFPRRNASTSPRFRFVPPFFIHVPWSRCPNSPSVSSRASTIPPVPFLILTSRRQEEFLQGLTKSPDQPGKTTPTDILYLKHFWNFREAVRAPKFWRPSFLSIVSHRRCKLHSRTTSCIFNYLKSKILSTLKFSKNSLTNAVHGDRSNILTRNVFTHLYARIRGRR